MFAISFQTAAMAVVQIFLIGLVGFMLVRRHVVNVQGLKLLSWLSINICFPFFIFHQIVTRFDPAVQTQWWAYPFINIALGLAGLLLASVGSLLFLRQHRREWMAVSAFHNAGYIPLLFVTMMPASEGAALYPYVILSIIGFDLCLWSLGVWLLTSRQKPAITWRNFINPPLVAMALGFAVVLLGVDIFLPEIILKPVKIIGDSALAIAMLTIGGNLALTSFKQVQFNKVSGAVLIKLMILPSLVLVFLMLVKVPLIFGFILMVQACMPTSMTLSIIARDNDNPRQDFINQVILLTHVLCVVTIPVFLGLYSKLIH